MLYIKRGQTNNMVVTASQSTTISPAYYLFSFVHILSKETYNFFPQLISTNARYDEFRFVETQNVVPSQTPPQVSFLYEGDYYYYVYEMSTTGSTNPENAVGLLENGRALVSGNTQDDCFYQFVSDNEDNSNYIFLSDCEGRPETPTPTTTTTPTPTPTITPTPSCPITTQYLEVQLQDNTKFKLALYNDASFTSPANALCDYTISGYAVGDLGTIYAGTETILEGQHNKQFDLAPVLLPGEIVISFEATSYYTTGCECPLLLVLP